MTILDGRALAKQIQSQIAAELKTITGRQPCLAVILVGEDPASQVYVARKAKACKQVGIRSIQLNLPPTIEEEQLLQEMTRFNNDPTVDGLLVQLPLPPQIHPDHVTNGIDPTKDVDGFHPCNVGKVLLGQKDALYPCTPVGIKLLMDHYGVETAHKNVVIVGRSNIVGKPMAAMLLQQIENPCDAVTIIHRDSTNLEEMCRLADILIIALGQPKRITADMIKEGATVIDVGINKVKNTLVGDTDFDNVKNKCAYITPVPGGVGPMTIAVLLHNTLLSYQKREGLPLSTIIS